MANQFIKKILRNKKVRKALDKEQELETQVHSAWEKLYNKLEACIVGVANSNYEKHFSKIFGYRFFFYIILLTLSVIFGMFSVFHIRGADFYGELLGMLTLGWTFPAGGVVFVLWNAQEKNPDINMQSIEFTIGIILTVCFCIFMQWGFYKVGDFVAWRDMNNARLLCESASSRFESSSSGGLNIDRQYLEPILADGTPVDLGHVRPPHIVVGQRRALRPADSSQIKRGDKNEIESVVIVSYTCRFFDPRTKYVTDNAVYSYDYSTGDWRQGY